MTPIIKAKLTEIIGEDIDTALSGISGDTSTLSPNSFTYREMELVSKFRTLTLQDKKLLEDNLDRFITSSETVKSEKQTG